MRQPRKSCLGRRVRDSAEMKSGMARKPTTSADIPFDLQEGRAQPVVKSMQARVLVAVSTTERLIPPGPHKLPELDRVVVAIHRKMRRAALAVHLLLANGFAFEATIVSRSIFEDSLKVGTLRGAGD